MCMKTFFYTVLILGMMGLICHPKMGVMNVKFEYSSVSEETMSLSIST